MTKKVCKNDLKTLRTFQEVAHVKQQVKATMNDSTSTDVQTFLYVFVIHKETKLLFNFIPGLLDSVIQLTHVVTTDYK